MKVTFRNELLESGTDLIKDSRIKITRALLDRIPWLDDEGLIDISVNYLNCDNCPTREICSEKHKYSNADEEICKKNLTNYLEK